MKKILVALIAVLALTSSALAVPVPVYDGVVGGVTDIQDLFNTWGLLPRYNATSSQTGIDLWTPHAVGNTSTLIFTEQFLSGDVFGIYNSAGTLIPLFVGPTSVPTSVAATFALNNVTVGSNTYLNFGRVYGYYFQSSYTGALETVYSEAWRNDFIKTDLGLPGVPDEAFMLAFRGDGGFINLVGPSLFGNDDWIIAGDYYSHGLGQNNLSLKDFDDYVVFVSEAQPAVPEPATMLLLGSGLIGLAGFARKRFKK